MKRILLALQIFLGISTAMYFLGSYLFTVPNVREFVRVAVEKKLSEVFSRKITVHDISGTVFSKVRLSDVHIMDDDVFSDQALAHVDTVFVELTPFILFNDFRWFRTITFDGVSLNVVRNKKKRINLFEFVREITLNGQGGKGRLEFKNVSGSYIDLLGWGRYPMSFQHDFYDGQASIQLSSLSPMRLRASFKLGESNARATIQGEVFDQLFDYDFEVTQLNTNRWAPYLVTAPGVVISDDVVTVRGQLSNKGVVDEENRGVYYDINVLCDYLTIKLATHDVPMTNVNGRIQLINYQRPQLRLDAIVADYGDLPVKVTGAIYFDTKEYDVLLQPRAELTYKRLTDFVPFRFIPGVDFDVLFDAKLYGSFKRPLFNVLLWTTSLKVNDYNVGSVYVNMLKQGDGFHIESLKKSDIVVSGNMTSASINMTVTLHDVGIPLLSQKVPLLVEFNGALKGPSISMSIGDIHQDFFGYDISNIQSRLAFNRTNVLISDLTLNLANGQKLMFDGRYDLNSKALVLDQTLLSKVSMISSNQRIDAMSSQFLFQYMDRKWNMHVTGNISGVGAKFLEVDFDEYQLNFRRHLLRYDLDIDYLYSNGQRFEGQMIIQDQKVERLNVLLAQVKLSYLEFLYPKWKDLDLAGEVSGRVLYQKGGRPVIDAAFDIKNFNTVHGQFGDLYIDMVLKDKVLDILNFKLRGLHYVNLMGTVFDFNQFSLSPLAGSMIRLDAFDYFAKRKLFGHLKLNGTLSRSSQGFQYDGIIESDDLEFDGNRFDYLVAELNIQPKAYHVVRSMVEFGMGRMEIKGAVDVLNSPKGSFMQYAYDMAFIFDDFDIQFFSNLFHSYQNVKGLDQDSARFFTFNLSDMFAYHKYREDNLSQFKQTTVGLSDSLKNHWDIGGKMNGRLSLNSRQSQKNKIEIEVAQFKWLDRIEMDYFTVQSGPLLSNKEHYVVRFENIRYGGDVMSYYESDIFYYPKKNQWRALRQEVHYQGHTIRDVMSWSYGVLDQQLEFDIHLNKNDIRVFAFPFSSIKTLQNDGRIHVKLKGSLDNLSVVSNAIELKKFQLTFNEKVSFFDSRLMVEKAQLVTKRGVFYLKDVPLEWQGRDTFRRVTRNQKKNIFYLTGQIALTHIDLVHLKSFDVNYDLQVEPTFFSINFPLIYSGDIEASQLRFFGQQTYPLSNEGQLKVLSTLGTSQEVGPIVRGQFKLRDGVFNVPKGRPSRKKIRLVLDLDMVVGPGNYVQGSIIGEGVYNLANNLSLEIDEGIEKEPFKVTGTLNALNLSTTIPFYEGSITIFDGVYELIRKEKQGHFFKEVPEHISDQYVTIRPGQRGGQAQLMFDIHLRGLRKKDGVIVTENIRNDQFPYPAVGLVIDGDLRQISSGFTVLDYGLDSYYSLYPNYEFYGAYNVSLSNQQSLSQQSYYGLNLVMPEIITNTEDTSFNQYGRQQVNSFVKSSIRPYERRLARGVGLYDLRIDYDFGRTLFDSDNDIFHNQDLLGVNLVSNLYREKMFFSMRADVDMSSDESVSYQKGVKITQVALKYFFQPNFSIAMKNINEYSDVTTFDPRFSLNYGYAF